MPGLEELRGNLHAAEGEARQLLQRDQQLQSQIAQEKKVVQAADRAYGKAIVDTADAVKRHDLRKEELAAEQRNQDTVEAAQDKNSELQKKVSDNLATHEAQLKSIEAEMQKLRNQLNAAQAALEAIKLKSGDVAEMNDDDFEQQLNAGDQERQKIAKLEQQLAALETRHADEKQKVHLLEGRLNRTEEKAGLLNAEAAAATRRVNAAEEATTTAKKHLDNKQEIENKALAELEKSIDNIINLITESAANYENYQSANNTAVNTLSNLQDLEMDALQKQTAAERNLATSLAENKAATAAQPVASGRPSLTGAAAKPLTPSVQSPVPNDQLKQNGNFKITGDKEKGFQAKLEGTAVNQNNFEILAEYLAESPPRSLDVTQNNLVNTLQGKGFVVNLQNAQGQRINLSPEQESKNQQLTNAHPGTSHDFSNRPNR